MATRTSNTMPARPRERINSNRESPARQARRPQLVDVVLNPGLADISMDFSLARQVARFPVQLLPDPKYVVCIRSTAGREFLERNRAEVAHAGIGVGHGRIVRHDEALRQESRGVDLIPRVEAEALGFL